MCSSTGRFEALCFVWQLAPPDTRLCFEGRGRGRQIPVDENQDLQAEGSEEVEDEAGNNLDFAAVLDYRDELVADEAGAPEADVHEDL
jgi:hypothetical protein